MIKKIATTFIVPASAALLMTCSSPRHTSTINSSPPPPVKMLCIFDGVVISKPHPEYVEVGQTKRLVGLLRQECETRFNSMNCIDTVKSIERVGYGIQMKKLKQMHFNERALSADDTIYEANGSITDILHLLCWVGTDSMAPPVASWYFKRDSNLLRLRELKDMTNSDYCMVNSVYGTVKRKPLSTAVRAGTAIATGLIALLSPVGGMVVVPGDETEFASKSYVINLNIGDVAWRKTYRIYQLYAVENFNQEIWGNKVFKKFKLQKGYPCITAG